MKESGSSALYATPELGSSISEYASAHSTPLPGFIKDYHGKCSSHERSIMLGSNSQSQFHIFLANVIGAKRVLEIGLYLGYSTMAWSHAVGPDGHVTSLELSPEFAKTSQEAFEANSINNIKVIVGPASESLKNLTPSTPYDLVFIDADKTGYATYLAQLLQASQPNSENRLLRPGALILADNVLREAHVVDDSLPYGPHVDTLQQFQADVAALKVFNERVMAQSRVQNFMIPLWDGISVMRLVD